VLKRFLKPEMRYARRMARIERWNQPMDGPWDRVRAWTNMLLVDHGVFRLVYLNKHRVSERLWRSAQPAPHQIARLKAEGVRTVVNLRGGREHGSWQLQKEACERLGLHMEEFVVRSRGAPDRDTILRAKAFFDRLEYPAVLHCKSGADRAGFVAALFLIGSLRRDRAVHPRRLVGGVLTGAGAFQLYDGLVQHKLLGLHQIRYGVELLPYDLTWNVLAVVLLVVGLVLVGTSRPR